MPEEEFDYIVVGAGSAGCVLAARLSEDPATRVLLLEAGPPDRSLWIHLPIGYGKTMWSPTYNWRFETDPDPNMNGRRIYWPRGKTLGGSSAINGLIYIRGQREDYDHWAALGNQGWGYDDVLPYFIKSEGNQRGGDAFHGGSGPLKVSNIAARHELIEAFIGGAQQTGVPRTDDFNGAAQEGAGYYQLTTHKGWRCSTAKAYLTPAVKQRPNLRIETDALAGKLVFDGRRAAGIGYRQGGVLKTARCRAEVLLSAGSIQSPQLLQLSGIGPRALLERFGIAVVHELPGVGENLQDHLQIRLGYECTKPITTNDQLNSWFGQVGMGLEWLLHRTGPLAVGINQGGCFMRALKDAERPARGGHARHPVPRGHAVGRHGGRQGASVLGLHDVGVPAAARVARAMRIRSLDAAEPPEMQPNYLATELDRATTVAGVKAARAIAEAPAMRPYVKREVKPGPAGRATPSCSSSAATTAPPSSTPPAPAAWAATRSPWSTRGCACTAWRGCA
jgi:choline dehydrogenase